jgi:hypothetical protein
MPLVNCPACEHPTSSEATACPQCGHPFKALTIEATAKEWKFLKIIGAIIVLGSMGAGEVLSVLFETPVPLIFGGVVASGGLVIAIYGAIGGWWDNG